MQNPPAGQFYASTADDMGVNSASTAAAACFVHRDSPFMMNPWNQTAAVDPCSPWAADAINMAVTAQAAEAAAAASALAQGFSPMAMQDAGLSRQGVRGGRVQKGTSTGPYGRKLHSSMKTKLQIKELQERYEVREVGRLRLCRGTGVIQLSWLLLLVWHGGTYHTGVAQGGVVWCDHSTL
jgi:hypothetical protein